MPTLQDKPRTDAALLQRVLDESASALASALEFLAETVATLANHLRAQSQTAHRNSHTETTAVLLDAEAQADLADDELDERSWEQMRADLGIGTHHSHETV